MEAGHQKDQALIRSLELSAPAPFSGKRKGVEVELITHCGYVTKPP